MPIKKIGVITSGGDCAGLNAIIKGIATNARYYNIDTYIIPNGYAGLYNLVDFSELVLLDQKRLEQFPVYLAGSEAGNSRVKIPKIKDTNKYERIRQGLAKFSLDALVISGGDDTGSVVVDLNKQGIACIHTPKTMDLDLMPYSVGGDSTINRIASFAQDLRTTGQTHNRILVMEVFGRYAGHTALHGGLAAQADIILIPEIQADFSIVYEHAKNLLKARVNHSDNYAGTVLIIVAEGLKDASGSEIVDKNTPPDSFGHYPLIGAGKYVVTELQTRLKKDADAKTFMQDSCQFIKGIYETPEVREVRPGHLVRCGSSSVLDVSFGLQIGAAAVELVQAKIFGVTVISYQEGKLEYMDCEDAIKQRHIDLADISLHERMGTCFGRLAEKKQAKVKLQKITHRPTRPY